MTALGRFCLMVVFGLASANASAAKFETMCRSPSGKSTYAVRLDTGSLTGQIRYRFMSQDVDYAATLYSFKNGLMRGTATFKSARSGESRGQPFEFSYDVAKGTFTDSIIVARCQ